VKEKKAVFKPGTDVLDGVSAARLIPPEHSRVLEVEPADYVRLAGLKPHHLHILAGSEEERQLIEVRKARPGGVLFPIKRIALQDQPLPGKILLQTKGPEARQLAGSSPQTPGLIELTLPIRALEPAPREDRNAVENPLADGVDARQFESHPIL